MKHELQYMKDFDEAWDELKAKVKKEITEMDCIDTQNEIKWPCWVCVWKREKEPMFKH